MVAITKAGTGLRIIPLHNHKNVSHVSFRLRWHDISAGSSLQSEAGSLLEIKRQPRPDPQRGGAQGVLIKEEKTS